MIRLSPEAVADLQHIARYGTRHFGAATAARTSARIVAALRRLEKSPYIGRPGREPDTRELVILRSPYIAIYAPEPGGIAVYRVIHGATQWPLPQGG